MMRIVKGEIRHESEGAKFLTPESRSVRLTDVFDQRDLTLPQLVQEKLIQRIVAKDVGWKHRFCPAVDSLECLRRIQTKGSWIDIDENWFEPALKDRSNI